MKTREQILILQPNHLGDVLLSTPFIHGVRKRFPEAYLSLLPGAWSTELFRGNPDADRVIACDLPWLALRGCSKGAPVRSRSARSPCTWVL